MTARPLVPTTRVVRCFSQRENLALRARDTVCTEAGVINTELQYHFLLETLGNVPACDSPRLYCPPHSPVISLCSHWSLVDVPLIFFCLADHVPDWQPRILLGMVEARSVNVKKTTTTTS